MSMKEYIEVNPIEEVIRGSGFVAVENLATSTLDIYDSIGDVVELSNIYPATLERFKVAEFVMLQIGDGSLLVMPNKKYLVRLFNSNVVTVAAGSAMTYGSGSDERDCIGSFYITVNDWVAESNAVLRATVHPDVLLKGTVPDANLGTTLYAVITAAESVEPPETWNVYVDCKLQLQGNIDA